MSVFSPSQDEPHFPELLARLNEQVVRDTAVLSFAEIASLCNSDDQVLSHSLRNNGVLTGKEYAILNHERETISLFMAIAPDGEACIEVVIRNLGHVARARRSVA
jgi:hypothetical protein